MAYSGSGAVSGDKGSGAGEAAANEAAKPTIGSDGSHLCRERVHRDRRDSGVQSSGGTHIEGAPLETSSQVWCDCSKAYEAFASAVTDRFAADAIRLARIRPGAAVLDVAAGTGAFAMEAARRGTDVLAVDFSAEMIRLLQRKTSTLAYQNVQTALMDGQDLRLPDERFDVAASLFGLMFFPDHERGLREMHRVLRPGGQAVVAVWAPPPRVELMRLMGDAVMMAGIDLPAPAHPPHWLQLCHATRLRARLEATGFNKVHVVTVAHVAVFEEAEELAQILPVATPSSASALASLSTKERMQFTDALAQGFRERQGDGPYAVTNEALIAVGTK